MATKEADFNTRSMVVDKEWLRTRFAEAWPGVVPDPGVTVDQLHAMMLADGVLPEDNSFSREILHTRYPDGAENGD